MPEVHLRRRFRIESGLAAVCAALTALTVVFPQWIEASTALDPDAGSGLAELAIAGSFLLAALVAATLARRDHRRLAVHRGPAAQRG